MDLMRLSSVRGFRHFRGSDVGIFAYILLFPLLLLLGLFIPPDWQRFGFQWQALGLTAVTAYLLWFADAFSRLGFLAWLFKTRVYVLVILFWVYMIGLGLAHGFDLQFQSLSSGLLFSLFSPVCFYFFVYRASECHRVTLSLILLVVLATEDILLAFHYHSAAPMNGAFAGDQTLLRVFVNVRDGNAWAIAASVVAFALTRAFVGFRLSHKYSASLGISVFCRALLAWFLVFFNAWISQGRGLFFAVFAGIGICAFSFSVVRDKLRFLFPIGVALCLSWCSFKSLSLAVCGAFECQEAMATRLIADLSFSRYGRLDLWSSWLDSGFRQSWLWGHGLGLKTDALNRFLVYTPHSLLVQILSDSALWGACFSLLIFFGIVVCIRRAGLGNPFGLLGLYSLIVSFVYLNVAGVLFWPSGVWLFTLSPLALLHQKERRVSALRAIRFPPLVWLCLALIVLLLMIFLIASKQLAYF